MKWTKAKVAGICLAAFVFLFLAFLQYSSYLNAFKMMHYQEGVTPTGAYENLGAFDKINLFVSGIDKKRPTAKRDARELRVNFEKLRFQGMRGEITSLYFPQKGSRYTFLMFHGYGSTKENYLNAVPILMKMGHSVVLPDFTGGGESHGSVTTVGILEADDVKTVFDQFSKLHSDQRIVLFGGSMGAVSIARAMMLYELPAEAVILASPFNSFLETMQNRFELMKIPTFPIPHLITLNASLQHGVNFFKHNPSEYVKKLKVPVLFHHGELDDKVTIPQAREIFDNIPTWKKYIQFEGVGHKFYADTHPKEWKESIQMLMDHLLSVKK